MREEREEEEEEEEGLEAVRSGTISGPVERRERWCQQWRCRTQLCMWCGAMLEEAAWHVAMMWCCVMWCWQKPPITRPRVHTPHPTLYHLHPLPICNSTSVSTPLPSPPTASSPLPHPSAPPPVSVTSLSPAVLRPRPFPVSSSRSVRMASVVSNGYNLVSTSEPTQGKEWMGTAARGLSSPYSTSSSSFSPPPSPPSPQPLWLCGG